MLSTTPPSGATTSAGPPAPTSVPCAARAASARDAGFVTRDDVVERSACRPGRDVKAVDFYEALASYKLAIILEGIHARYLMGKTVGDGFDHIGGLVEVMAQGALDAASHS